MKFKSGLSKLSVLVVDDDYTIQKLIKDILLTIGFESIASAPDGLTALELLKHKQFDLILCDWRMPRMSGIDFVKNVRSQPPSKNSFTNIIMVTGNAEISQVIEARDVGVNDYIVKPFTVRDLCNKIINLIENPRPFILSDNFKGPSRRAKEETPPDGEEKRKIQQVTMLQR